MIILVLTCNIQDVHAQNTYAPPVFQTDFENVRQSDPNTLNIPVENWFEFGDYDGSSTGDGARMWIDNTRAHSGTKSIGLEVFDITKSRRAEFNIYPYSLVGDELSVSQWLYLPADFGLHAPGIDWNWFNFNVLFSEYSGPGTDRYLDLTLIQPDTTKSDFQLTLGGRRPPNNTKYLVGSQNSFALQRGKWFNVHWYLKRDASLGAVKVWIDGKLIFDYANINTKGSLTNYNIVPAKVYYETSDTTPHQMWVDDVVIYKGYVPPVTVLPTASPIPSPTLSCASDINQDGKTDLLDYSILARNFFQKPYTPARADVTGDGAVDVRDFTQFLNYFLKACP